MVTISGVVLAGGKSRRFGQDKGLYPFRGKPLVMHALKILRPHCDELLISTNNPEGFKAFGVKTIKDIHPDCGPLGGIHSGLTCAGGDLIALIPCDTPFVPSSLYTFLLHHIGSHQAIMPTHGKYTEPMCAIYAKNCLDQIEQAMAEKRYKILDALKTIDASFINVETQAFFRPDIFHNINYKKDL